MQLQLRGNELLRLVQARGAMLSVVSGRIWLTEEGCADDCFFGPGAVHRIIGDGLVLVGAESTDGDRPAADIAVLELPTAIDKGHRVSLQCGARP